MNARDAISGVGKLTIKKGSTFKIYLPRLAADEDADTAAPEKKTAARGTETILLVEDEPTILRMYSPSIPGSPFN